MVSVFHRSKKASRIHPSKHRKERYGSEQQVPEEPVPAAPFYAMLENLQRGILPRNEELLTWFASIRHSGVLGAAGMSETGRRLMQDVQELIEVLESVIKDKNRDEIIQRFLYHARLAARIAAQDMTRTGKVKIQDTGMRRVYLGGTQEWQLRREARAARKRAQGNVRMLYDMLRMTVMSTDLRDVVGDTQRLVRKAISARPGRSATQPIVMPVITETASFRHFPHTPERTSIDTLKSKVSLVEGELERIKAAAGKSNIGEQEIRQEDWDRARQAQSPRVDRAQTVITPLRGTEEPGIPSAYGAPLGEPKPTRIPQDEFTRAEHLTIVKENIPDLKPQIVRPAAVVAEPQEPVRLYEEEEQYVDVEPEAAKEQPRQAPQQARDHVDELLDDLHALMLKINASPEIQSSIRQLYSFLSSGSATPTTDATSLFPRELRHEANFFQAQRDLVHIMERFASNSSLDPTIDVVQRLRREAVRDYALKDFLADWSAYLTRCVTDAGYLEHKEFRNRGRFLFERTAQYSDEKYRPLFEGAVDSFRGFADGWSKDATTQRLGQVATRIVREDLLGQPDMRDQAPGLLALNLLKPDLFQDFRNVLLPSALRHLHQIPLPRIEVFWGEANRLVLENMVLPGDAILPMNLEIKAKSALKMHPRSRILGSLGRVHPEGEDGRSGWKNGLIVRAGDIKTSVRDVKFVVDHSTAFPRFKDVGLADIEIGGRDGMSIVVNVIADMRDVKSREEGAPTVLPHYVRVSIDRLRVKFHHSQHDAAYAILSPVINYSVKKAIETTIRDRIVQSVDMLDDILYRLVGRK